jgi:hypothetical protein
MALNANNERVTEARLNPGSATGCSSRAEPRPRRKQQAPHADAEHHPQGEARQGQAREGIRNIDAAEGVSDQRVGACEQSGEDQASRHGKDQDRQPGGQPKRAAPAPCLANGPPVAQRLGKREEEVKKQAHRPAPAIFEPAAGQQGGGNGGGAEKRESEKRRIVGKGKGEHSCRTAREHRAAAAQQAGPRGDERRHQHQRVDAQRRPAAPAVEQPVARRHQRKADARFGEKAVIATCSPRRGSGGG